MNAAGTLAPLKYIAWIADYMERNRSVFGRCKEAVKEMVQQFPELTAVPGHVQVPGWGKRGHWWCTTKEGQIVDPTASQFPHIYSYEPWKPGDEVMVGKCFNCGDEIWVPLLDIDVAPERKTFCDPMILDDGSEEYNCEKEYEAYLEKENEKYEQADEGRDQTDSTDGHR